MGTRLAEVGMAITMAGSFGGHFRIHVSAVENAGRVHPVICSSTTPLVRLESKGTCGPSPRQSDLTKTARYGAASRNSDAGCLPLYASRGNGRLGYVDEGLPHVTPNLSPRGQRAGCLRCGDEGCVECPTCRGSGLYIDSILESQGIIVKVKCIGCGGNGDTLCPDCGGNVSMKAS